MSLKPYWLSWYHKEGYGPFELSFPWWISGYGGPHGEKPAICAAVRAVSEQAANDGISASYDSVPMNLEFRFCTERPGGWSPFNARFERADWMRW